VHDITIAMLFVFAPPSDSRSSSGWAV